MSRKFKKKINLRIYLISKIKRIQNVINNFMNIRNSNFRFANNLPDVLNKQKSDKTYLSAIHIFHRRFSIEEEYVIAVSERADKIGP